MRCFDQFKEIQKLLGSGSIVTGSVVSSLALDFVYHFGRLRVLSLVRGSPMQATTAWPSEAPS